MPHAVIRSQARRLGLPPSTPCLQRMWPQPRDVRPHRQKQCQLLRGFGVALGLKFMVSLGNARTKGVAMLIPVDGRDLGLPDDVVDLTKRPDLVEAREIPRGSTGHGFPLLSRSSFNLERRDEALDRYSSSLVGGLPLDTRVEPLRIPVLERWTVQAHAYSTDVAGKVGLLGRLFGGEAKTARAGVVHEAKRFTIQRTEQDRITECGVAVRILAATTDWEAKVQLTLPNLAADAQL